MYDHLYRVMAPRSAPRSNVPATAPQQQHLPTQAAAQPRQPGMFAHMASTAAGVAVGSAVGHTVGAAITGGLSGGSHDNQVQPQEQPIQQPMYGQPQQYQQAPQGGAACQFEMKQFMDCAQNQYDITLCQGFNEALKQCKLANVEGKFPVKR